MVLCQMKWDLPETTAFAVYVIVASQKGETP
jgi:hypothetical protein